MSTKRRGRPRDEGARQRIVQAATALFLRDGYLATTVGEIAAEAGVSPQTIYSAYASKVGVLAAAHDTAIAGDDPRPLLDREWATGLPKRSSIQEAWAEVVPHVGRATEQVAPIYRVIESAAADPDVAQLLAKLHAQRYRFSRVIAERLLPLPGTRADADVERVADILYAVVGVPTYLPLVVERGWTTQRWQQWAYDTGADELIA